MVENDADSGSIYVIGRRTWRVQQQQEVEVSCMRQLKQRKGKWGGTDMAYKVCNSLWRATPTPSIPSLKYLRRHHAR